MIVKNATSATVPAPFSSNSNCNLFRRQPVKFEFEKNLDKNWETGLCYTTLPIAAYALIFKEEIIVWKNGLEKKTAKSCQNVYW